VTIEGASAKERLTLLWAGEGWPADVEEVLAHASSPWPRELVVVGRDFSPGALKLLRDHDANWVDETGDARIIGPSHLFVIRLQPDETRGRTKDERRFAWTPSAIAVAEAILAEPIAPVIIAPLAAITGFSAPQISRTLLQFDRRGWTLKFGSQRGSGALRKLEDKDGLLRSWATYVANEPRRVIQAHATLKDPLTYLRGSLLPALDDLGEWALSGWAGLELEAPFATQVPVLHLYVPEAAFAKGRVEELLRQTRLRRVDEGGRVIFWPGETAVLRLRRASRRHHLPVVTAARLYADLMSLGGRGVDAAEHVRESLID
jgi:hypothetical protein